MLLDTPSQASTVQSYGWAMLNYAGEADEAGRRGRRADV